MLTRRNFEALAVITGGTLAAALRSGGEETRTAVYNELYRPLVAHCNGDNPEFDSLRFSAAVGKAETEALRKVPIVG